MIAAGALMPLTGCSSGPKPDPAARAFLTAWGKGDDAAAGRASDAPPTAAAAIAATRRALASRSATFTLGAVHTHNGEATATYSARMTLRALGEWAYQGTLALRKANGRWVVHWAPADLHPQLGAGQALGRTRTLPLRAAILDGTGKPLTRPTEVVTVSILPAALTDRPGTVALLGRTLGVDVARLNAALATAEPTQTVPVIALRQADYVKVRARLHDVPGLRFPMTVQQLAPTPTFARAILGRTGPATAEALAATGSAYQASDEVGLSGLQAAYQSRLAGTAAGSVVIRDSSGVVVTTLHTFPGTAGQPVRTTLNNRLQGAAEAVLAAAGKPAALVAVRPSTGAVLAAANTPAQSSYNRAFVGRYPPGSTFKVVTTAALLGGGLRPGDPAPCPPTRTVEGKVFRNFEGEAVGSVPFSRDFAISCNTAFVGLSARLPAGALPTAGRSLGVGAPWTLPLSAYTGSVPTPASAVDRAAEAIGQGRVTVSPLSMALVAAAVSDGTWRPPVLVAGQPAGIAPVPLASAPQLRQLMRGVVISGTATSAFRSYTGPPVAGKTGTAEFGTGSSPATHAWFIGFQSGRDLAVAVLVEGGGVGGAVAAPLAARFLQQVG